MGPTTVRKILLKAYILTGLRWTLINIHFKTKVAYESLPKGVKSSPLCWCDSLLRIYIFFSHILFTVHSFKTSNETCDLQLECWSSQSHWFCFSFTTNIIWLTGKKKVWCPLVTNMGNNMVVISHAQFPFRFRNSCKMFGDLEVIQKKFYREHVCWSICLLAWRNAFLSHFFYLLTTFVISIHTFTARSWGDKSLITVTSWQQQVLRLWTVSSVFQVTGK